MRARTTKLSTRTWVMIVMLGTLVLGSLPATAAQDSCANGGNAGPSKAEATALGLQGHCVGNSASTTNELWYTWQFDAPGIMLISFANGGDLATLHQPVSGTIAPTNGGAGTPRPEWRMRAKPGVWYLQIRNPGTGLQNSIYDFTYHFKAQADCNQGDAGNVVATATECSGNQFAGQVWGNADPTLSFQPRLDADDWYKFTMTGGQEWQFDIAATMDRTYGCVSACGALDSSQAVKYEFRNASGTTLYTSDFVADNNHKLVSFTPPADGDYLLHLTSTGDYLYTVERIQQSTGVQTPSPSVSPPSIVPSTVPTPTIPPSGVPSVSPSIPALTGDCAQAGDAPNSSGAPVVSQQARPVGRTVFGANKGDICPGNVGAAGDPDDWYSFTANSGQQLEMVMVKDGAVDTAINVYDPSGTPRYADSVSGTFQPEIVSGPITGNGTWKVRVRAAAGAGNYIMYFHVRDQAVTPPSSLPTALPTVGGVPQLGNDCNTGKPDAPNTNAGVPTIASNGACLGQMGIPSSDTADWYAFPGVNGQDVVAVLEEETTLDVNLDLYNPSGIRVFPPSHFDNPIPEFFRYTMTQTGSWKLAVTKRRGAGKYGLFLSVPSQLNPGGVPTSVPTSVPTGVPSVSPTVPPLTVSSPDCDLGRDASNAKTTADAITPPKACTAHMPVTDPDDWYRFNATEGQRLIVNAGGEASLDLDVLLYAPNGEIFRSQNAGARPESVDTYAGDTGVYYIQIHRRAGAGDYGMTVTVN